MKSRKHYLEFLKSALSLLENVHNCFGQNTEFDKEMLKLLVSTHVICERLSAMQGLPESGNAKFLLKLARTPCSGIFLQNTPEMKSWPDLGTLTFDLERTPPPPNSNFSRSWHFDF